MTEETKLHLEIRGIISEKYDEGITIVFMAYTGLMETYRLTKEDLGKLYDDLFVGDSIKVMVYATPINFKGNIINKYSYIIHKYIPFDELTEELEADRVLALNPPQPQELNALKFGLSKPEPLEFTIERTNYNPLGFIPDDVPLKDDPAETTLDDVIGRAHPKGSDAIPNKQTIEALYSLGNDIPRGEK